MSEPCPCGTGKPYAACCGPLHEGRAPAPRAVTLMRSRYAAYVLGLGEYLLATWHPSTRPRSMELDPRLEWTGLAIESTTDGQAWDDAGTVRFAASWRSGRRTGTLRETSRFATVDGRWYYVDGAIHRL